MQPTPDLAALMKIVQSPAGQKLLALLQANPSADLDSIASAASSGNMEDAKKAIGRMLSSQEAKELLKQLEKQL